MTIRLQLASSDPEDRRLAAQALAHDATEDAPTMIARALADSNWRVRKEAAQSAVTAPRRAEVLRALLEALGNRDNVGLRNSAVEALVAIGPDAVPTAIAALRTLDADGRKLAVEVLGGVPDLRSAEALASATGDADANVGQAATEALGASALAGDEARKIAVRALRSLLPRAEPLMKLAALGALTRLDVTLEWSLLAPLASDPLLRGAVLAACGRCTDPSCGEALVQGLFDANVAYARAALVALSDWLHTAIRQASPIDRVAARLQGLDASARVRALGEIDTQAHGAALTLLALLGDAEAAPAIVRALLEPQLARSAETAVSLLGAAALPALLAVGEREPPSRHAALLLVVPTLTGRLDDRARCRRTCDAHARLGRRRRGSRPSARRPWRRHGHRSSRVARHCFTRARHELRELRDRSARRALSRRSARCVRASRQRSAEDRRGLRPARVAAWRLRPIRSHISSEPSVATTLARGARPSRRSPPSAGTQHVPPCATALADEDRDVQLAAVRALGRLRHAEPLSALVASAQTRRSSRPPHRALAEADAVRALEVCTPLVTRDEAAVACAAVVALGKLSGPRARGGPRSCARPPERRGGEARTVRARAGTERSRARARRAGAGPSRVGSAARRRRGARAEGSDERRGAAPCAPRA